MSQGEIAENLAAPLDEYMLHRLVEGNVRKNPAPLQEVAGLLQELREAWERSPVGREPPVPSSKPDTGKAVSLLQELPAATPRTFRVLQKLAVAGPAGRARVDDADLTSSSRSTGKRRTSPAGCGSTSWS